MKYSHGLPDQQPVLEAADRVARATHTWLYHQRIAGVAAIGEPDCHEMVAGVIFGLCDALDLDDRHALLSAYVYALIAGEAGQALTAARSMFRCRDDCAADAAYRSGLRVAAELVALLEAPAPGAAACFTADVPQHFAGCYAGPVTGVTIAAAHFAADRDAIYGIRRKVFIVEQSVPEEIEIDAMDPDAHHVLAFLDGQPVGTGRITADGRIGRMAVLADYRARGVGRAILDALMEIGRAEGLRSFHLSAQCHAIPFYEKAGFVAEGPVYMEAGIAHRGMQWTDSRRG